MVVVCDRHTNRPESDHTMTRTTLTATALLLAVTTLTSCSYTTDTPDSDRGRENRQERAEKRQQQPHSDQLKLTTDETDELYLTVVRDTIPAAYAAQSDADLISLAHTICDGFDGGMTFADLGIIGHDAGMPPKTIGVIIGAGTVAYCPEHEDQLP